MPLTRLADAPIASAQAAGAGVAYTQTFTKSTVVWRHPPDRATALSRNDWLLGIAASAGISACVSLLSLWLWGPSHAAGAEPVDVMTVTYEPLEQAASAGASDRAEPLPSEPHDGPPEPASLERGTSAPPQDTTARVAQRLEEQKNSQVSRPAQPTVTRTLDQGTGSAAVASAPAVNQRAALVVTSEPAGAHVTINGVGYGLTPLTIPYLSPGAKRLRATKSGYQSEERVLGVDAARSTTSLRIVLRELPATPDQR